MSTQSTNYTLPFDVTAGRHGGNVQSVAANSRIAPHKATDRERVRVFVAACGWNGATLKEVAAAFGVQLNQISGRFSELKRTTEKLRIYPSGRTRNGCAVYVSEERWCGGAQ